MTKGSHLYNSQIKEVESRHAKADSIVDEFYATEFAIAASLNDIPALCATVKALRFQLAEWEAHRPGIIEAVETAESTVEDLQSQLAALREENERLTKERDRAREDIRILTNGRFIQS